MNFLKKPIDYEGLEEELEEALKEDALYELRNTAKLRAVEQRVPSYEHFRQMVNGAHLKPLEPKDKSEKVPILWNRESKNLSERNNFSEEKNLDERNFSRSKKESISENFWKFDVLHGSRGKFKDFFKTELPADALGKILSVCLENFDGNAEKIVEILREISECRRFNLAVIFMSQNDKLVCKKLFCRLKSAGILIDDLRGKLNVY